MDLASRLQKLEEMIREAKSMPLSSSALLNREEVLELVLEMRESLPEEIKQARWVVKDREELLAKARAEAEDYVDAKLAQFEAVLQRIEEEAQSAIKAVARTAEQVGTGRLRLRATGTVADQELSPPEEDAP